MHSYDHRPPSPETTLAIVAIVAVLALSPFAVAASIPLLALKRRFMREFLIAAALATALAVLLAPPALAHVQAALAEMRAHNLAAQPRAALAAAWPALRTAWLMMLPTA